MIIFRKHTIDLCFKTVDGQRAFFPHGKLSRGRVVNPDQEATLRRFLTRWFAVAEIMFIAMIVLQGFIGIQRTIFFAVGALALLLASYYWALPKLLKDSAVSDFRVTGSEIRLQQAQATSAGRIYYLLIVSVIFTAVSAISFKDSLRTPGWETVATGLGTLLFGAGVVFSLNMIRLRRSAASSR